MLASLAFILALAATSTAHTGAFGPGMYCRGGSDPSKDDQNTNTVVNPLYMLTQKDWFFQHDRGCDAVPPAAGDFLELPANGTFTVELAHNRAQTTLSYDGKFTSEWPDGQQHPEDWNGWTGDGEGCIQDDGAMHVQNETSATGTAFAISYHSDISEVTMENLAVFTVLEHSPWKRIATYQVPDLPACPPEGCTCAYLWVPKGCGQPNMYMQGFKCMVTGATATHAVAPAKPPVYCAGDASKCVKGAKQMIAWNQADGDNVFPDRGISPGYNADWGFFPGAQKDIFEDGGVVTPGGGGAAGSSSSSSAWASPSAAASSSASAPPKPESKSSSLSSSTSVPAFSAPVKPVVASTSSGLPPAPPTSIPWTSVASTLMTQVKPTASAQHACHHK